MKPGHLQSTISAARTAFHEGDFETALQETRALLEYFSAVPHPVSLPGGVPEIDDLLQTLGRRHAEIAGLGRPENAGGDWVLATTIYESGGHTPVIRDLHEALPDGLAGIVLTHVNHDPTNVTEAALRRTGLSSDQIHSANGPTLEETFRNIVQRFHSAPPQRLFLFQHPYDTAAIASASALQAAGVEIWLMHHADAYPSAGLYLRDAKIVDFTARSHAFATQIAGLRSVWLPLTCPDPGPVPNRPRVDRPLVTALSGSGTKVFQGSTHDYSDAVATILAAGASRHVHIGPLESRQHETIASAITAVGGDPTRFVHLPFVTSLSDALISEQVDIFINTWPIGGARAVVESMAAGVPIVWHSPHETLDRLRLRTAYPGAALWRDLPGLGDLLRRADAAWLAAQSQAARSHYETMHHPSRWRAFFAAPGLDKGEKLPDDLGPSEFFPHLWHSLLDFACESRHTPYLAYCQRLQQQDERLKTRLQELKVRLKGQESECSIMKQRLRALEREISEARFPWLLRLIRRWKKRPPSPGDTL